VNRSLPIIQKADVNFMEKAGCFSCHNQGLAAMAVGTARRKGFTVDEKLAALETKYISEFFASWRERLLQGFAPGGSAYSLVGLHDQQYKPDLTTDAVARYVRQHQLPDGHFQGVGCGGSRPPLCFPDHQHHSRCAVYSSMHLVSIKPVTSGQFSRPRGGSPRPGPYDEDRAIACWGLPGGAAGTLFLRPRADCWIRSIRMAAGGHYPVPSDAYATGQSLVALNSAGILPSDPRISAE
jgi:hypothetical protein